MFEFTFNANQYFFRFIRNAQQYPYRRHVSLRNQVDHLKVGSGRLQKKPALYFRFSSASGMRSDSVGKVCILPVIYSTVLLFATTLTTS